MSASVLVKGTLFRAPESRISKAGNAFVMATLKERNGTEFRFWKIFAFGETACAELERLGDGDALSVQGGFEAKIYEKAAKASVSLSVTADHVLALRQPPKKREPKVPRDRGSGRPPKDYDPSSSWQAPTGPSGPDDEIPF